jgi:hypothetical protein
MAHDVSSTPRLVLEAKTPRACVHAVQSTWDSKKTISSKHFLKNTPAKTKNKTIQVIQPSLYYAKCTPKNLSCAVACRQRLLSRLLTPSLWNESVLGEGSHCCGSTSLSTVVDGYTVSIYSSWITLILNMRRSLLDDVLDWDSGMVPGFARTQWQTYKKHSTCSIR